MSSQGGRLKVEGRYVLADIPPGVTDPVRIHDRYIRGTNFCLRIVSAVDGRTLSRELSHNVIPDPFDLRLAFRSIVILDEEEYGLLSKLPADDLVKVRHRYPPIPAAFIDVHEQPLTGLVMMEVDFDDLQSFNWFGMPDIAKCNVTTLEEFTGRELARP